MVISILSVSIFGHLLHEPDVWTGRVLVLMLRERADLIRDLQPSQVALDDGSHAWPTVRSVPLLDQKSLR